MRVGIFDSGVGGLSALAYFREMAPEADVVFFADRENAPYGTKAEGELVRLVSRDIKELTSLGCERVLMACCTASTVHRLLPSEYRIRSIPIIAPTARSACRISRCGGIGVLSTEATKRSGAFVREITNIRSDARVLSVSAGELVTLAEAGVCDENIGGAGERAVKKATEPFLGTDIDTLILGCTHFGKFKRTIEAMLGICTVDSAKEGAIALFEYCSGRVKI